MIRLQIQLIKGLDKRVDAYVLPERVGEVMDEELAYLTAIRAWLRSQDNEPSDQ